MEILITKFKAFVTIPLNLHTGMSQRGRGHLIIFYGGRHFSLLSSKTATSLQTQSGQEPQKGPSWGSVQGITYKGGKAELLQCRIFSPAPTVCLHQLF